MSYIVGVFTEEELVSINAYAIELDHRPQALLFVTNFEVGNPFSNFNKTVQDRRKC